MSDKNDIPDCDPKDGSNFGFPDFKGATNHAPRAPIQVELDISSDKLTSFLYELMRDELAVGVVQRIINNSQVVGVTFTNAGLTLLASQMAKQLR